MFKKIKETWKKFTSWLGKAWSSFIGLFSSNGATKAGAANSPASGVPNNDAGVSVPEPQVPSPNQVRNPDQKDEVDLVGNDLSATDPSATEVPAAESANGTKFVGSIKISDDGKSLVLVVPN